MTVFTIPYPPKKAMAAFCREYGLNAIYAGKHWTKRKKDSEYWHTVVKAELVCQGIRKEPYKNPVHITFYWNDRMDCSNHAYLGKMIEDSMKGYLLADDSRKYVQKITHTFHDLNYILVKVEEINID